MEMVLIVSLRRVVSADQRLPLIRRIKPGLISCFCRNPYEIEISPGFPGVDKINAVFFVIGLTFPLIERKHMHGTKTMLISHFMQGCLSLFFWHECHFSKAKKAIIVSGEKWKPGIQSA